MTALAARHASGRLVKALIDIAAARQRTHCSDVDTHHSWLSENEAERQQAALWCHGCPITQP